MAEEKDWKKAKTVFKTLCDMLDGRGWKYQKEENDEAGPTIYCGAHGDDLPMEIRIRVDVKRELISLLSKMPFPVPENRRTAMAIAVSKANAGLVDGSFDYNYLNGNIVFRLTSSYRDSIIGKTLFDYMLMVSCYTIDEYNDKFLEVTKKDMSVDEILKFIQWEG